MSTYKARNNSAKYRKIYEQHHGKLRLDEFGRTYEVHHLDGNHENNDIGNLIAVTIQEHYDIHASQGDWGACYFMAIRMKKSPEEIAEIARQDNIRRVDEGSHHWLGPDNNLNKVKNGTHPFQTRADGTNFTKDRVINKTHNWMGSASNEAKLQAGTHASQIKKTCEYCGTTCSSNNYSRHHGERCKSLKKTQKTQEKVA